MNSLIKRALQTILKTIVITVITNFVRDKIDDAITCVGKRGIDKIKRQQIEDKLLEMNKARMREWSANGWSEVEAIMARNIHLFAEKHKIYK